MSADNGYVVLIKSDVEYGVSYYNASCLAESGSEYDPDEEYLKTLWEGSKKFNTRSDALTHAHDLSSEDWTEYGVCEMDIGDLAAKPHDS